MTQFGINTNLTPAEQREQFPNAPLTRRFVSGVLSPTTDLAYKVERQARPDLDAGLRPYVSFKLATADVMAGKWDAKLSFLNAAYERMPNTRLIYFHEPENNMKASDFVPAFDRVRNRLPAFEVGYSAMAYQFRPGSLSTTDPHAWFPEADFYGCDAYSADWAPEGLAPLLQHRGFMRWHAALLGSGYGDMPFGLTERGFSSGGTDAQRADLVRQDAADWPELDHYILWNTTGTENSPKLLNGPLTLQALRDVSAPPSLPASTLREDVQQLIGQAEEDVATILRQLRDDVYHRFESEEE